MEYAHGRERVLALALPPVPEELADAVGVVVLGGMDVGVRVGITRPGGIEAGLLLPLRVLFAAAVNGGLDDATL